MKQLAVFTVPFMLLIGFGGTHVQAGDIKAESHITAVTVYADRATVTREATVQLPAGTSEIDFVGLPANVMADSLHAQGKAAARVVLGSVESKLVTEVEVVAAKERELTQKLQDLQDKRNLTATESEALAAKKKFLVGLGEAGEKVSNENFAHLDLHADQWAAASGVLFTGLSETLKSDANLQVSLREMDKQILAVQTELQRIQIGQKNTLTVSIPVVSAVATALSLKISYQVTGATWRPLYDARLDTGNGKLQLTQFGEVRQLTGEDWTDVKMTLSTAEPARGTMPPAIMPFWVSIFEPRKYKSFSDVEESRISAVSDISGGVPAQAVLAPRAFESSASLAPMVEKEAEFVPAQLNATGYVNEYEIAGQINVATNNVPRKLMIGDLKSSSEILAQARPALDTNVYLIARTKLEGDAPLLSGNASLFRDGVFIGNMTLPLLRPGIETNLFFGVDDQIEMKRQVLSDVNGTAGLLNKDITRERKTVSVFQNAHKFPVRLDVLEALPQSRDDRLRAEILKEATTPGYDIGAENVVGVAKWTLPLQAGGKGEVKLGWRLSWPQDLQISGLPD